MFLTKASTRKESYGRRWWRFRVIRDTDDTFNRFVAAQAYNLTHELVLRKLGESSRDSRYTGATDAAWMELDRAVKEFATNY